MASTAAFGQSLAPTGRSGDRTVTGPIVFALFISLLAGLCAYVITLEEAQHHFPSRRRQQLEALRTGLVAMLFFLLLAVVLAFTFSRMFPADPG
jgi:hypothetical protein